MNPAFCVASVGSYGARLSQRCDSRAHLSGLLGVPLSCWLIPLQLGSGWGPTHWIQVTDSPLELTVPGYILKSYTDVNSVGRTRTWSVHHTGGWVPVTFPAIPLLFSATVK